MDFVNTKITSSDANAFFGNNAFLLNSSVLEATLRYISLKQHSGAIEKIELIKAYSSSFSSSDTGNNYADAIGDYELCIFTKRGGENLLTIDLDGWVSMDSPPYPVASFLSKCSETRVFVNQNKKQAIVFVKTATDKWIDAFCSSLFRILPWRFPNGVTETEQEFFKALYKQDANKFTSIIDEACKDIDFRSMVTRRTLIGWGAQFRVEQIGKLKSQGDSIRNNIAQQEVSLGSLYNDLATLMLNLEALQKVNPENDSALYDFFTSHKQLSIHKVAPLRSGGKSLYYSIVETIEYYDKDAFIRVFENPRSDFNYDANDAIRKIFYAIFAEEKGVFRTHCIFKLDNLSSLTIVRGERPDGQSNICLPHPHLVNYGCLGANGTQINKYMLNGDWDLAIEQSIAAAKNLNWGDNTVVSGLVRDVRNNMNCKCIIADNGTEMTPNEFLKYITEQNNEVTDNG